MNKTKIMFVLLASFVLGACSSSDDGNGGNNGNQPGYTETEVSEAPQWQMDWTNNQERPSWTEPADGLYASETNMKLKIEEALMPFASEGDMLAVFVNGEIRGLATEPVTIVGTNQKENGKFMFKVFGNETVMETVNISLQYYSQTLKHIFTLSDNIKLDPDMEIGFDTEYVPPFTYGPAKYPVVKTVSVEPLLTKAGLTPVSGNKVGAFVGDECRGTATLFSSGSTQLLIYGRSAGESVTLQYYDATVSKLYTIQGAVNM